MPNYPKGAGSMKYPKGAGSTKDSPKKTGIGYPKPSTKKK